MPDLDLRRRALESNKTVSRKAQAKSGLSSRASSRAASAVNSRNASRVASRDASSDEGDHFSDTTNHSIGSIDELLETDDINENEDISVLGEDVRGIVEALVDRKGTSSQDREASLVNLNRRLSAHLLGNAIHHQIDDLCASVLKSIRDEASTGETTAALKALTLISASHDTDFYDAANTSLRRKIESSEGHLVKTSAIHALSLISMFADSSETDKLELMTFLLEIISSDGAFVNAEDSVPVVTAATQAYTLLATYIEDMSSESEDAIEILLAQLDSSDVSVQIAAGEAIALLFEKSYAPGTESSNPSDAESGLDSETESTAPDTDAATLRAQGIDPSLTQIYLPYHDPSAIQTTCTTLSKLSTHSLSKDAKKRLHSAFTKILTTVNDPRAGPRANSASKNLVRIHRTQEIKIDKWWKLVRLEAIKRCLGGGMIAHYYEGNERVLAALPVIVRYARVGEKKSKGDKWAKERRFVGEQGVERGEGR